jgi:hypothetical protein
MTSLGPRQPTTLDEAIVALTAMLGPEDRAFLLKGPLSTEEAIGHLHHSLGRHLRNTWGFWSNSPLAQHLKTVHNVAHPDDMSHAVIAAFCQHHARTAWERIANPDL